MPDTTPLDPPADKACRHDRPVRPRAWLHMVRVCNGEPGELDEALSFAPDNFPFGETGLFEGIAVLPLYDQAAIDAAVAAERERLRAMLREAVEVRDGPEWPLPGSSENMAKRRALWARIDAELNA